MSLLPVSPVAPLAVAGAAVGTAGGAVVGTFARLLGAALNSGRGPAGSTAPTAGASNSPPAAADGARTRAAEVSVLQQHAADLRAQFVARFRELLADQGLDAESPVRLAQDEFGNLRVVGFHPEAAAIEHALATAPELVGLFEELAAATRAFTRPFEHELAASAPGMPPDVGSTPRPRFVLSITPGAAEGAFEHGW
ncbi:MAG TPA: hypothetical protein VML55_22080 [Planctomycetaceae bacterium]|nr:hypothetical protein [Planctomycetaceae bacterium]